jgi:membrane associated rhomboid family serine protease
MDGTEGNDRPPEGVNPDNPTERRSGLLIETCYRHPNVTTGVHCTRCGRPICPDCMVAAPVGYQCPDCARQARAVGPRRRVRFVLGRPGFMTSFLLALNISMFVVEVAYGGITPSTLKLFNLGALFPPAIAEGHQYWRLFTAMFLHASFIHLAFNMYALYLFGYLIENAFGWRRYIAIYLVSGFLASVASFAFGPVLEVGVGASGAIFGLLGAWVAFNYRRRTNPLASANLQGAMMLIVLNALLAFVFRGIDWRAHVGGVVAGFLAGWIAEGVGPRAMRQVVQLVGLVALLGIGVALIVLRVATFPTQVPGI